MPKDFWKKFLSVGLPLLLLSYTAYSFMDRPKLAKPPAPAFNVDFGVWRDSPSKKTGPAAAGKEDDYWNSVAIAWDDDHTETGLFTAWGELSKIRVRLINLGGGWGNGGKMGIADPMMDSYNYPANNKGGDSQVILYDVPAGSYDLYVYGHGASPSYYGDYELTAGSRNYGRKATSAGMDAVENTSWVEGSQYVKFSRVKVKAGDAVKIYIRPGDRDAMICGLQLIRT